MSYLGDYRTSDTVFDSFCTVSTTGAPTTLAGTPKLRCYKNGSTTESSDITPTVDLDGRTGLHTYSIDLTGDAGFYAAAKDYQVVITAGTVGGTSVVGYVVAQFSVENRSAVMPTTAARKLDVSAGGEAGVDWANVGSPTTANDLSGTNIKTNQKVDIETIKTQAVTCAGGVTVPAATLASTTNLTAGTIATVSGNVNGSVGSVTGAVGSVTGAVGSVTGAVGSVTGNVGGNVVGSVASVTGNVGGNVTGSVGSLAAQAKADVNAEALDVLNVDTYVEPGQEAPGATVTLAKKISYLYKFLRNKVTQDATTLKVFADDAVTVDQKSTVSDDGTTYTRGEIASGP